MTPLEFMSLFSDGEQLAIATAALQSPQINLWMMKLAASQVVDINDPRLQAGLAAMVGAGLLAQDRADAIIGEAGPTPVPATTFQIGDKVRVLPPFDGSYPDIYTVARINAAGTAYALDDGVGGEFAEALLQKVEA